MILSDELKKFEEGYDRSNKLVNYFCSNQGYMPIEPPRFANELECPFCESKDYGLLMVEDGKRVWVCHAICSRSRLPNDVCGMDIATPPPRSLLWPLFCEINGIGNVYHNVRFEDIDQSSGKIDYMLKFVEKPFGLIYMQGPPGTGKTYASMAMCELYTRKDTSCVFNTQRQMVSKWLESFKNDWVSNYIEKVTTCNLLVIDDFGTAEPSPGFLSFFMDLLNTRLQWTDRGTVITTNLETHDFQKYCGPALSDRVNTGQYFQFSGKTRRKQTIL